MMMTLLVCWLSTRYETKGLNFFATHREHRKGVNNIVDLWHKFNMGKCCNIAERFNWLYWTSRYDKGSGQSWTAGIWWWAISTTTWKCVWPSIVLSEGNSAAIYVHSEMYVFPICWPEFGHNLNMSQAGWSDSLVQCYRAPLPPFDQSFVARLRLQTERTFPHEGRCGGCLA